VLDYKTMRKSEVSATLRQSKFSVFHVTFVRKKKCKK